VSTKRYRIAVTVGYCL